MCPWRPIKEFRGETDPYDERRQVDLWVQIYASPRSMGMSDAFRVPNCWKKDGKWFHWHNKEESQLFPDYITHWMRVPRPPRTTAR